uniref:Regulatory protein n=1 Tax=Ackermannviridae sp. ctaCq7 TaxID=2827294 RepID=A0A8S5R6M3_9CAUD|nr:MAG TPA: regulatory protein [Ackermannviridae sp. ctaCq7]
MENNNYIGCKNFNTQEIQGKITSLELLKQINIFREQEYKDKDNFDLLTEAEKKRGHYVELQHKTLLDIIRDEFEEEITGQKILLSEYKDPTGRKLPMYILELDQAKQILMRESKFVRKAVIKYINKLENELNKQVKKLPTTYLEALEQLLETEKARVKLEKENVEIQQKLEYKQEIINGLSEETKLQTQRQFLNEIMSVNCKTPADYSKKYNLLYDMYDKVRHIKVRARCEGYNLKQTKQKDKLSVLGYIDEVLGDIPTLFKVAVKLFESDIKDRLQKYMEAL